MVLAIQDTNLSWWVEMAVGISMVAKGPWSGPRLFPCKLIHPDLYYHTETPETPAQRDT